MVLAREGKDGLSPRFQVDGTEEEFSLCWSEYLYSFKRFVINTITQSLEKMPNL